MDEKTILNTRKTKAHISEGVESLFKEISPYQEVRRRSLNESRKDSNLEEGNRDRGAAPSENKTEEPKFNTRATDYLDPTKPDFDVLIIGSGYGASIAAYQIAHAEKLEAWRVGILERGREFLPGAFPAFDSEAINEIRFSTPYNDKPSGTAEGLFDIRLGPDLNVVQANGLGGGSLINAGVLERASPRVFEQRWPKSDDGDGSSFWQDPKQLENEYEKVEELLFSKKNDEDSRTIKETGTEFLKGIKKYQEIKVIGKKVGGQRPANLSIATCKNPTNIAKYDLKTCIKCGDCATGCNYRAKNSLDQNLLLAAKNKNPNGVNIFTGATAIRIFNYSPDGEDEHQWGVEVVYTDPVMRDRQKYQSYIVSCRKLILAAGSLGSTELLLKSKSADLQFSEQLGKKFSSNGDLITGVLRSKGSDVNAIARHPECNSDRVQGASVPTPKEREIGPSITGMIDLRSKDVDSKLRDDIVIQEMAVPASLNRVFREVFTTAKSLRDLSKYDLCSHKEEGFLDPSAVDLEALSKISLYASMGLDDAEGQLTLPKREWSRLSVGEIHEGILSVDWKGLRHKYTFDKQVRTLNKLHRNWFGRTAMVLPNPIWKPLQSDIAQIIEVGRGPLVTVHPLGGCSMGLNAGEGVTNIFGQVYKPSETSKEKGAVHKGLYVLDGSILPSSVGINPALTISAVCNHAIVKQIEKWNLQSLNFPEGRPQVGILESVRDGLEGLARAAPISTKVEVKERLFGECKLISDGGDLVEAIVEFTAHSKPEAVADLMKREAKYVDRELELDASKSKLRVFYKNEWDGLRAKDLKGELHESKLDDAAKLICELNPDNNNNITIFMRAKTSGMVSRISRSLWAWLRNRGIREYLISKTEEGSTGSLKYFAYLPYFDAAGEKRTMQYRFTLKAVAVKANDFSYFTASKFEGRKHITYQWRSNPWRQLSNVTFRNFPVPEHKTALPHRYVEKALEPVKLCLDTNYLARQQIPLIQIAEQENQSVALSEIGSFSAYITRMLFRIHFFSFRKPDSSPTRMIDRFAGKAPGLPNPINHFVMVDEIEEEYQNLKIGSPVNIRLTEYRNPEAIKPPVLMIHGYSASSTTFAHKKLPNSLAKSVYEDGRSVWVVDLRTSCAMPTSIYPWKFEDVSEKDIPAAIDFIVKTQRKITKENSLNYNPRLIGEPMSRGNEKVDIVAHCMGAVMLSMAILKNTKLNLDSSSSREGDDTTINSDDIFRDHVGRIVFNQATPTVLFTPENNLRSFITSYVKELIPKNYEFRPEREAESDYSLLDRLLYTVPYPEKEFEIYNPIWKDPPFIRYARTRHRMDALYSRTFELENVSDDVLEHLDDFFGPINIDTLSQVNLFASRRVATNYEGRNLYVSYDNLSARWPFKTLSLHSKNNGMLDYSTRHRTQRVFTEAGVPYISEKIDCDHIGHQDSMIGKNAHELVFPRIINFLNSTQHKGFSSIGSPRRQYDSKIQGFNSDWYFEAPQYGPVLIGPGLSEANANPSLRIGFGSNPAISSIPFVLLVPVIEHPSNKTLRVAGDTQRERGENLTRSIQWSLRNLEPKNLETNIEDHNWLIVEPTGTPVRSKTEYRDPRNKHGYLLLLAYPNHIIELESNDTDDNDTVQYTTYATQTGSVVGSSSPVKRRVDPEALEQSLGDFLASEHNKYEKFETGVIACHELGCGYESDLVSDSKLNERFSFVIGSCQYPAGIIDSIPAYRSFQILGEELDDRKLKQGSSTLGATKKDQLPTPKFMALLGDQIYADATAGLMDPTSIFDRYVRPYWRLFGNQHVRNVTRQIPVITAIDDHEMIDNWEPTCVDGTLPQAKNLTGSSLEKQLYDEQLEIDKFLRFESLQVFRLAVKKELESLDSPLYKENLQNFKGRFSEPLKELLIRHLGPSYQILSWRLEYKERDVDYLIKQVLKRLGVPRKGDDWEAASYLARVITARLKAIIRGGYSNTALLGEIKEKKLRERQEAYDKGKRSFLLYQRGDSAAYQLTQKELQSQELFTETTRFERPIFVCDVRTEREVRTVENSEVARIMSEKQTTSLIEFLKKNKDTGLQYIFSSSILLPRHKLPHGGGSGSIRLDGWDGYPASLQEVLATIADEGVRNAVFLSGDEHLGCYAEATIDKFDKEDLVSPVNTGEIVSIHSPGLYTPFPFANGKQSDFTNLNLTSTTGRSRSDFKVEEFSFEHGNYVYRCNVYAHFDFLDQQLSDVDRVFDDKSIRPITVWMDAMTGPKLILNQIEGFLEILEEPPKNVK